MIGTILPTPCSCGYDWILGYLRLAVHCHGWSSYWNHVIMAFLLTCVFFHELPISDLLNIDLILMSGAGPVEFDVRHQI